MIIGVDEAGRGPIIGPMCIAAVVVEDDAYLKAIGVRDSKTYSPASRDRTFKLIEKNAVYSFIELTAERIDRERDRYTLNEIEVKGFVDAMEKLYSELSSRYDNPSELFTRSAIYVDSCDVNEDRFARHIAMGLAELCGDGKMFDALYSSVTSEHKADDKYPVVSAASVVAKTYRERAVAKIKKELGGDFGSGYPSDVRTRDYLTRYVRDHGRFPPHTRLSWKTAEKIRAKASPRTLYDF